jgi:hypothetical protein
MPALAFVPMPNTRDSYSEQIMADAATDGIDGFQRQDHRGVQGERGPRQRVVGGHSDDPHPPHRRQVRDRARHAPGLQPPGRRPDRDRRLKWRIANPPKLVLQPQGQPSIEVEVGTETFTVLAEELDGTARAEVWPKLIAASPSIAEFQAKTTRQIPLFVLTRED